MTCGTRCRRCGRLLSEFIRIEITIGARCLDCLGDYAPPAGDEFDERQLPLPLFPRQFV
jgi:hypothetical protein